MSATLPTKLLVITTEEKILKYTNNEQQLILIEMANKKGITLIELANKIFEE